MDFNKKVLIYVDKDCLKPTGGAAGYNYNLYKGLSEIGAHNFYYLENTDMNRNRIKKMKDSFFKKKLFVVLRIINYYLLLNKKNGYAKVELKNYDIVHFHNVKDMYEARSSLKGYKGIVILTSHSPKPFSYEIYEDVISSFERKVFGRMYRKLIVMEKYAFDRADYIIFPCEDAEEPYYKKWAQYKNVHERNKDKYRYLLTGTSKCEAKISKNVYRKRVGIKDDSFVISYVGRHNSTKGYDSLKRIGIKLLENKNIYFLIGGKEEPLKRLNHNNWIEVGWTNDPHSLINASDIFILPNEETYFDLVMLEVLSLGKVVVASETGGNKQFEKMNASGIFLYSSEDEAIRIINYLMNMEKEELIELGNKNKKLYNNNFCNKIFAKNYIDILNSMW